MLLSKGFEVEVYTGQPDGTIVGLSDKITAALDGFVREPDSRNVEYTTPPCYRYERILCDLLLPRFKLRQYLTALGDYTIVPGSALALSGADRFQRSDPNNPYHTYIEQTYGTDVVTASIHINIGIADPEILMRACRLVRLEAPLYLALSASSPFFNGQVTGQHSSRWAVFPKTPTHVPLFKSHAHFIEWTEQQLILGTMQNVRHLWSSVRPNGDRRPYNLNRLELRICDLVSNPVDLLAITTLLESRLTQLIHDPTIDPLVQSQFSPEELVEIADRNEIAVAQHSLDAVLQHWQDGRSLTAREWINDIYISVKDTAKQNGIGCFLTPISRILREGNEAMLWLSLINQGLSVDQVLQQAIIKMREQEVALQNDLCVTTKAQFT
ncbi:glutamate--cysteine ligase [filamentous cyanobacterium LEGE 11480]|uniref:Glutamate--cysteine ligase n=1 Tax=Romeriopsis navalis LEGE 11480 TaxID=2777977 RepID=A0A928Z659_9CYAN|nr:glutamate--cysteine ligase [Romeriopsis navalis]MBE9032268.1 glutamate--cysteine ligase [Romeriopsis navalis LEGE 11480]